MYHYKICICCSAPELFSTPPVAGLVYVLLLMTSCVIQLIITQMLLQSSFCQQVVYSRTNTLYVG